MSLITDIKKLRELEQKAQDAPDWPSPVEEVVYTDALLQHAPAMLEVLGCFRAGDAAALESATNAVVALPCAGNEKRYRAIVLESLNRLQKAASLMDQEREG